MAVPTVSSTSSSTSSGEATSSTLSISDVESGITERTRSSGEGALNGLRKYCCNRNYLRNGAFAASIFIFTFGAITAYSGEESGSSKDLYLGVALMVSGAVLYGARDYFCSNPNQQDD